jgi:hypothetical protein
MSIVASFIVTLVVVAILTRNYLVTLITVVSMTFMVAITICFLPILNWQLEFDECVAVMLIF